MCTSTYMGTDLGVCEDRYPLFVFGITLAFVKLVLESNGVPIAYVTSVFFLQWPHSSRAVEYIRILQTASV